MQRKTHFGREFYKTALVIAIPIVIQNLISIGLNMADTIMIGKLGVDELAAVGTANRLYFVFSTLCFGVYSGAAVYVSQYWGVRDIPNIRRTFGIDLCLGGGISLLFMTLALALAPQILFLFTRDANVIGLGSGYLRIVSLSYPLTAMSFAVNFNSRAIHNLRVPTLINMMALCINLVLNYGLIYGKLGMPQLGVNGAAIATLSPVWWSLSACLCLSTECRTIRWAAARESCSPLTARCLVRCFPPPLRSFSPRAPGAWATPFTIWLTACWALRPSR